MAVAQRGWFDKDSGRMVWVEIPEGDVRCTNSVANTDDDVRRLLRQSGYKATAAKVDAVGREVRRTASENETLVKTHKEMEREYGIPSTVDSKGRDVLKLAKKAAVENVKPKRPMK